MELCKKDLEFNKKEVYKLGDVSLKRVKILLNNMTSFIDISVVKLDGKILSIYEGQDRDLYIGVGNRFVNYSKKVILETFEKSVRCISGDDIYVGCGANSGDGKIFFLKTNNTVDKIEGPVSEIKGIDMWKDYIAVATRGKTVWILENLEIEKIFEDHSHDVKGCKFHDGFLYTWSYDGSLKIYNMNSLELVDSVIIENKNEEIECFFKRGEILEEENNSNLYKEVETLEKNQSSGVEKKDVLYDGRIISDKTSNYLETVWTVNFLGDNMFVSLGNGVVIKYKKDQYGWKETKWEMFSLVEITVGFIFRVYFVYVVNLKTVIIVDQDLKIKAEIEMPDMGICSGYYYSKENKLCFGAMDGSMYTVSAEELNLS